MTARVDDNTQRSRFEAYVDGELAGYADYRLRGGSIVFTHTEVDDSVEGQGVGSALVSEALDAARDAGLEVIPSCPFVAEYLRRHPEYVDLVPQARRREFDLQGA